VIIAKGVLPWQQIDLREDERRGAKESAERRFRRAIVCAMNAGEEPVDTKRERQRKRHDRVLTDADAQKWGVPLLAEFIHRSEHQMRVRKLVQIKRETTIEQLCSGLPDCFHNLLSHARNLAFMAMPNYKSLIAEWK
jgi:hypothetical protein